MDYRALILGLAFAFMWSSAFTSSHILVDHAPPLTILAIRFWVSGAIAVAIGVALGQTLRLSRGQWRATVIFGLCQNALYLGAYFVAMQWIPASLATIIASTMPLMVALIGWIFLGDRLPPVAVAGLVLGVAGVALIMGTRLEAGASLAGVLICLAGSLALAVATLAARGATGGGNLMMVVGLQMLVGAAVLSIVALFFEPWQVDWSIGFDLAFVYTVLVPGILATWVWFTLVHRIGAVKAATYHFLNPFFGVLVAAAVLSEPVGVLDMVGVAIVAAGILCVQLSRQKLPA